MEVSTLMVGWGWTWEQLKAGWTEIEALDFDACYMGDDMFPHYFDDDPANAQAHVEVYDPWTVMPVMAETTERMRIGSLVTPVGRRHPALFAKITSLVDIISNGRLTVSLGAGNSPDQQAALGQPWLSATQRSARLEEEVRILRSLWANERTDFAGEHFTINKLVNYPKPVRQPGPEIQIAFKSKKFLTRLAAEFADRVNVLGKDDEKVVEALDTLKMHCKEIGRDHEQIKKGRPCAIVLTETEIAPDGVQQVLRERAAQIGRNPDAIVSEHEDFILSYVGPPDGCVEALRKSTAGLGFDEIVMVSDTIGQNSYENTMQGLRLFAAEVMPEMKAL